MALKPDPMAHHNDLGQEVGFPLPHWQPVPVPGHGTLAGRYCRLVPLDVAAHGEELYRAFHQPLVPEDWTYLPYGPFADQDTFLNFLEENSSRAAHHFYAILLMETGQPVGWLAAYRFSGENGSAEIGHVAFSRSLQRTAASTEAVYLVLRHLFASGYRRVEWKCNSLNVPSRRAAQRLGFTYEGTFRQMMVVKGHNRDTDWFSMLDSEWPSRGKRLEAWLAPENFDEGGRQRLALGEIPAD